MTRWVSPAPGDSTPRSAGSQQHQSRSRSALQRADARRTDEVHVSTLRTGRRRGDRRPLIRWHGEAARSSSLRWSCAVSQPPSTPQRVDDPLGAWCRGCRRSRSARWRRPRPPRAARPASRSGVSVGAGRRRAGLGGGPVAGPDRGDHLGDVRALAGRAAAAPARSLRRPGPAAGRAGRRARCRRRPRRPARRRARAAGGAARRAGVVLTSTVGAIRRSPSEAACGWCSSSVSAASSSARRNASACPTRTVPKRAGGVVDEVGQRLRHRGARDRRARNSWISTRRPAGVERAAHRRRR